MTSELPNWESLQGRIDGDVALPGSPAYQAYRRRSTPGSVTSGRRP